MRILICVSHVPDTTAKISFSNDNKEYNKEDIQFVIGPYEELALTRVLELKETISLIRNLDIGIKTFPHISEIIQRVEELTGEHLLGEN